MQLSFLRDVKLEDDDKHFRRNFLAGVLRQLVVAIGEVRARRLIFQSFEMFLCWKIGKSLVIKISD